MNFLFQILLNAPPLLIAVILHEVAHGYIALKLGDPTAKMLGRISLNPIKHIDPVMTLLVPFMLIMAKSPVVFGGAKPVPVDPRYFKNPRQGMAIVAIAGPITNFLLATFFYGLHLLFISILKEIPASETSQIFHLILFVVGFWIDSSILINIVLGLFNLLPVPPLDGGRILVGVLPLELARKWAKLERWGLPIVVLLIYSGAVNNLLAPLIELVLEHLKN